MSKIYPTTTTTQNKCHGDDVLLKEKMEDHLRRPTLLTVWKRSSMSFQGTDGFTVFDGHGNLVFRVDNYSRNHRCVTASGLVLMDGVGNALLFLKPQILSMQCQWNAYREEDEEVDGCGKNPKSKVFSMKSSSVFFNRRKDKVEVFMVAGKQDETSPDFRIEGSFRSRNCKIKNANGEVVAKITRKRVNSTIMLSDDVFSLAVQPGYSTEFIMAFVVILDRISSKAYTPIMCT